MSLSSINHHINFNTVSTTFTGYRFFITSKLLTYNATIRSRFAITDLWDSECGCIRDPQWTLTSHVSGTSAHECTVYLCDPDPDRPNLIGFLYL